MSPWKRSAAARASSRSIRSPECEMRRSFNRFFSVSLCLRGSLAVSLLLLMGAADAPTLITAVKSGDAAAVRALIQQGVNVNAAAADGATALHWASYRDDLASADLLLRSGANVNAANDLGTTPL